MDGDFLHSALFRGSFHHPTDNRMKVRKTNRELLNEPLLIDIDPGIIINFFELFFLIWYLSFIIVTLLLVCFRYPKKDEAD